VKEKYNIYCKGRLIHSNLTEDQYFETMGDLSRDFYETGSPNPDDLKTEMLKDEPSLYDNRELLNE